MIFSITLFYHLTTLRAHTASWPPLFSSQPISNKNS